MKPGTPGFIGERLRQARVYRGLSKTELARRIGTSQPSITQYENGSSSPSPAMFLALSEILEFDSSFFLRAAPDRSGAPVFYRSIRAATKGLRERTEERLGWASELTTLLESYVKLPAANVPEFDVPHDPATLSLQRIEEIAGELRWRWRLGEGAISDVSLLLENNGVVVLRFPLGDPKQDGLSWRNPLTDRPFVIISAEKESAVRSRFDIAHELGHLILHRHVRTKDALKADHWKLLEEQAHYFAGAFLLPAKTFTAALPYVTLGLLVQLKPLWKVSIGAMLFRCQKLGIISKAQAELLWETYGRRRWKAREPLDDILPPEQPRILRRAVELVVSHQVLSRDELATALAIPTTEIEEIVGLPAGFFEGDVARVELRTDRNPQSMGSAAAGGETRKVIPLHERR